MLRTERIMLTPLSHYAGPKEMIMPKITVNHPVIIAKIPAKVFFAGRSEDRIYVTSETPELLGCSLFKFLNREDVNYAPGYISLHHKASYFQTVIDRFLQRIEEQDFEKPVPSGENLKTPLNCFSLNLSNSILLQFLVRPEEIPGGLHFISKVWAIFHGEISPLDKLDKDLRNFIFAMGSYNA